MFYTYMAMLTWTAMNEYKITCSALKGCKDHIGTRYMASPRSPQGRESENTARHVRRKAGVMQSSIAAHTHESTPKGYTPHDEMREPQRTLGI